MNAPAKNGKKAAPTKKEPKRLPVLVTEQNIKRVREKCGVTVFSNAKIRAEFRCTWKEAVALRHAALKKG